MSPPLIGASLSKPSEPLIYKTVLAMSVHEHTAWLIMHSPFLILIKQWLCLFACSIKHVCNDTRQESLLLAEEYIIWVCIAYIIYHPGVSRGTRIYTLVSQSISLRQEPGK